MSYKERDNMKLAQQIGEYINSACKIVPGGILVFFTSYGALTRYLTHWRTAFVSGTGRNIYDAIGEKKIICVEDRQGLKQRVALDRFMSNYKKGAIFMGVCEGKLSEGINFKDDMARLVIIVGIPYANIKDQRIKTKMEYLNQIKDKQFEEDAISGGDWYEQNAIRALNQSVGRIIRHINDYGAILILDNRFIERPHLLKKISNWISKKLKVVDSLDDVTDGLKRFFDGVKKCLEEQGGFWADHKERELAKARQELELGYNEQDEELDEIRQRLNLGLGLGPGVEGEGDEYEEPPPIHIEHNDLQLENVDTELDDLMPRNQSGFDFQYATPNYQNHQETFSNVSTGLSNQKQVPNPFKMPEVPTRVEMSPNSQTRIADDILGDLCREMDVDLKALDDEFEEPDPFGDELGDILTKPVVEDKTLYQRILMDSQVEIGPKAPPKQQIMPPPPKNDSFFGSIPKLDAAATAALTPSLNKGVLKPGTVTIIDQSKALEKPVAKVKQSGPSALLNPNSIVMTQLPKFKSPVVGKSSPTSKNVLKNLPFAPNKKLAQEPEKPSVKPSIPAPEPPKPSPGMAALEKKVTQWNYPSGPAREITLEERLAQEIDDLIGGAGELDAPAKPITLFNSSLFSSSTPASQAQSGNQQSKASSSMKPQTSQPSTTAAGRQPAGGYQSLMSAATKEKDKRLNTGARSSSSSSRDIGDELDGSESEEQPPKPSTPVRTAFSGLPAGIKPTFGTAGGRMPTEEVKKYMATVSKSGAVAMAGEAGSTIPSKLNALFGTAASVSSPPQKPASIGAVLFGGATNTPQTSGLFSGGSRGSVTPMNVRKEELRKAAEAAKKPKGKL